jgi:glycosyltransferase involved in cell wall biosynthesis
MIIGSFEPVELVQRSIESVKDYVDGLYITVTYTDKKPTASSKLIKLLKSFNANISYFEWVKDFAEARNFAMSQVPKGKDAFIYWQDADDVLVGAQKLQGIKDDMVANHEAAVFFDYWYQVELDEVGEVREILVKHKRERIIRHDETFKWIGDLHETLINQQQENVIRIFRKDCYVVHLTSGDRLDANINRNIEILEAAALKEQHKDPRTLIYLAKAYFDKVKMAKDDTERKIPMDLALTLFHEYLAGSGTPGDAGYQEASGWKEERSTAWAYIAEIAIISKHPEVAIGAYQNAIDEAPQFPNYYIDMAMCYVVLEDYAKAKHWLLVGTQLPEPNTTIIQFPREIKSRAMETSFHINMHENKLDEAVQDAEKLVEMFPDDAYAKQRVETVRRLWIYNKACQSIVFLGKYLEQIGEKDKIAALVESIPNEMKKEKFASEMSHLFLPARIHESNEVSILCGPGFEKWGPDSLESGIGGSEEAVVRMSKELTAKGWKVTVYGDPQKEGDYDGVTYKEWHAINQKDEFNVLILWRAIGFVDINPKAKFTLLWLHDVPSNPDFTEERVAMVDKIAVLSEYHKSLLRMSKNGEFVPMPENKVFVTTNGIPELDIKWDGNPARMIYSSSPDRGLPYLLRHWGKIKNDVPEAELHIFYGFEVYDAIHKNNPARQMWKEQVLQMMKQDGIIYHGRVGHDELHKEMAKSGVWAYPTDFEEISCITGMKAQALGAVPVVTNYAALEETVKNGFRVDVDIRTIEGQDEYINTLINVLKDPKKQEEVRAQMVPWAKKYFLWSEVAEKWDQMLRLNLQNPELKYESNGEIKETS